MPESFRRRGSRVPRGILRLGFLLPFVCVLSPAFANDSPDLESLRRIDQFRALSPAVDRLDGRVARIGGSEFLIEPPTLTVQSTDPVTPRRGATTDWAPYVGTFGLDEAAHLLRRTVIGPSFAEIESAAQAGLAQTVADLLAPQFPPPLPGPWATQPIPDIGDWDREMIDSLVVEYQIRGEELRMWWTEVMLDAGPNVTESMTHFWHDHFATGLDKVFIPQSMYIQNALFRQQAVGNFSDLTRSIGVDPAMLYWLDNQYNYVGQINENFARELLELFTLGVDEYSQDDVIDVARAYTGYVTEDGITFTFYPELHDFGEKTILGQTGNWDADDVIDILFQQDVTARFICGKLYQWFIDEYPDEALIEQLAQTMRANNYDLAPVLEQMFLSEHFFDTEYRGSAIRDGVDMYVGVPRALGMASQIDLSDYLAIHPQWIRFSMVTYDHILLEPPNVSGWDGYRSWVNATSLPWRKSLGNSLVDGMIFNIPLLMQADVMALVDTFRDPDDPYLLIEDMGAILFGLEPTELVNQRLLDELLQGAEPWEWSTFDPDAETRIQGLIRLALRLPDSQLK